MNTEYTTDQINLDHVQRIAEAYGFQVRNLPDGTIVLEDPHDNIDEEMRSEGTREAVLTEFLKLWPDCVEDFDEVVRMTEVPTCPHLLAAINAVLSTDNTSTDEQLAAMFAREFGITDAAAKLHVQRRDEMLSGIPCVHD